MTTNLAILPRDWSYPIDQRSSLENPQTPLSFPAEWLLDIFNGGRTDSGIRVSEMTAFQTTTFLACVDLIAGKISSLPRLVLEQSTLTIGKRERSMKRDAREHDYYDLIAYRPNPEMNGNTWMKSFLIHCLAWQNGYTEIQRDEGNNAVALWPRNPSKTRPKRLLTSIRLDPEPWRPFPVNLPAGSMIYETTDAIDNYDQSEMGSKSHSPRLIPVEDMIHVPGISFDGRIGTSVVWLARQTLGLALAQEKYGAKYFANYAKPGGILEVPNNIQVGSPAWNQARNSWMEAQGGENAHRVAVMPAGYKWTAMSDKPQEAQSVESKKQVDHNICALFHVPPHMIGDVDKGRSNTEQLAQELKEYCLEPWLSAIRVEVKVKLFPHRGFGRTPRNNFYLDFDLTGLLRPDSASREKFNASGKQWGYLNSNDICELEGRNPINDPAAEKYWQPVNMTLTDTPIDPTFQDGAGNGEAPPEPKKPKTKQPVKQIYSRMFRDGLDRFLRSKTRNLGSLTRSLGPVCESISELCATEAEHHLGVQIHESGEVNDFIADYFGGVMRRSNKWDAGQVDRLLESEIDRAIAAIRIAVFRAAGTVKAKLIEGDTDEG